MPENTNDTTITISLRPDTIMDILDALHTANDHHSDDEKKGVNGRVVTAIKDAMRAEFDKQSSTADAQLLAEGEQPPTAEDIERSFAEFANSLHLVMRAVCCIKKRSPPVCFPCPD